MRPGFSCYGAKKSAPAAAEADPVIIPKGRGEAVELAVTLPEGLTAPVAAGEEIGEAVFTLDGETVCTLPLTAAEEVREMDFAFALGRLWELFTRPPAFG